MVILIIIFTKELKDYLIYGWVAWDGAGESNNCIVKIYMEQLQEYPAELFADLYNDLECITIKYKNGRSSRMGFPKHRATVFGLTKQRFTGKTELSADSLKYPEIYNELLRIGNTICPMPFNSIYVNHNVVCPLHKDRKNIGKSLIVSFGDYSGCKLIVNGEMREEIYA